MQSWLFKCKPLPKLHHKFSFCIYFLFKLYRTILAALHFNYNLHRETKLDKEKNPKLKVSYPKFKEEEAVVREVKIKQNYGKYFITWKLVFDRTLIRTDN